ncbi:MAG TPA: cellulase family glycosylhydrolase, partial [Mycobacteriales bacterium]|nr:cellulase family glycosylhydrolase [Mycobacteriales bacterium]
MRLRARLATAVAATTAVLAATAGFAVSTASATAAPAAPTGLAHWGTNVHLMWSGTTTAQVDLELDLLASAGANSARADVSWSSLQVLGKGTWEKGYVARLDALVDGAARRGIGLVLVLNTTPCWASTAPDTLQQDCTGAYWDRGVTRYAPADPADFATAAAWLAGRYGDRVAALELWNEPNLVLDGVTPLIAPDQAAAYAGMVKAAYPAVKAVAPQLPVLAGSLSFADDAFLQRLYAHGIRGHYDAVSVHPYNEWRAPGAPHDARWYKYDYVLGLEAVRRAMTAAGDTSPVWVTEVGWTSCTVGADRWCVTREQQAAFTEALLPLTAERFPWVRAVLVYGLRDKGRDATYTEDNFGLIDRDNRPKPAWDAAARAFRALAAGAAQPAPSASPTAAPTA